MPRIAKEAVAEDIKRVRQELAGEPLTRDTYRERGAFSSWTVDNHFGSFQAALDELFGPTEEQLQAVVREGLAPAAAAEALGLSVSEFQRRKAELVKKGFSPAHDFTHVVPDGFKASGVSTYYNAEGKPTGQWVKASLDRERQFEIMRAAMEGLKSEIPRMAPVPGPAHGNDKLLNCFILTDFHLGMLSLREETGADYDLGIAEQLLVKWFEQAIALSPDAETAVFAQLSDFLHSDGIEPLTPASKHVLDVDTRFAKIVRSAIRVLRQVIDMLLAKHKRLHLIMADANHDPVSQIWLREWFAVLYENDPRVTVDRSPSPYNAFEFGDVALFVHHGHKRKVTNVAEVFAAQFREMFGRTKYAYAHTGHLHSIDVKENNLMVVEQHRTLAAPDAYSARGGWLSGRDAQVITYHKSFGEVSRLRISSDMLK